MKILWTMNRLRTGCCRAVNIYPISPDLKAMTNPANQSHRLGVAYGGWELFWAGREDRGNMPISANVTVGIGAISGRWSTMNLESPIKSMCLCVPQPFHFDQHLTMRPSDFRQTVSHESTNFLAVQISATRAGNCTIYRQKPVNSPRMFSVITNKHRTDTRQMFTGYQPQICCLATIRLAAAKAGCVAGRCQSARLVSPPADRVARVAGLNRPPEKFPDQFLPVPSIVKPPCRLTNAWEFKPPLVCEVTGQSLPKAGNNRLCPCDTSTGLVSGRVVKMMTKKNGTIGRKTTKAPLKTG
jgi:hypothetical protein